MLKLFAGLGLVDKVMRPQRAFSSPRSQFFSIQTSQSSNNINYIKFCLLVIDLST